MQFKPPPDERIGYLLMLCRDHIVGSVEDAISQLGMDMLQYRALWLARSDSVNRTQSAIASKLELTPTAVSRMISEMMELGWVRQVQNDASRREKFIKLTDKGKEILMEAGRLSFAVQTELLAHMSEQEQQDLKRLLRVVMREPC